MIPFSMARILDLHRQHTSQPAPEAFLSRFPGSFLQYLDDTPAHDPRKALSTSLFDVKLAVYKQSEGCGVYFSPNGFVLARRLECLKQIQAVFLDLDYAKQGDGFDPEELELRKADALLKLLSSPRPPHAITETKHGLQPIWRVQPLEVKQGLRLFREAMVILLRRFGGDAAAKDPARVLRLPGFLHLKDPAEPFRCTLLWDDRNRPRDHLQSIIDDLYLPPRYPPLRSVSLSSLPWVSALDVAEVIREAAWEAGIMVTFRPNADGSRQIVEDEEVTSGFISARGNFCYSSSGKPRKGGPLQLVQFYLGLDREEAKQWLAERFRVRGYAPRYADARERQNPASQWRRGTFAQPDAQSRASQKRPESLAREPDAAMSVPDPSSSDGSTSPLTP